MRRAKRRPERPGNAIVGLRRGDLLYKCWFSSAESRAPVQVLTIQRAGGHLDIVVAWFREGKQVIKHRCGNERPFDEGELDQIVREMQAALNGTDSGVTLELTDFTPYKTREEQERVLKALGYYLERV